MTPSERIKQLEDAIGVVIAASTSATPDYFTVPTEEMGELARVADGDIAPPTTPESQPPAPPPATGEPEKHCTPEKHGVYVRWKGDKMVCMFCDRDAGEKLPATYCDVREHRRCYQCGVDLSGKQVHFDQYGNAFCEVDGSGMPTEDITTTPDSPPSPPALAESELVVTRDQNAPEPIRITSDEFHADVSEWVRTSQTRQVIVMSSPGVVATVLGIGPVRFTDAAPPSPPPTPAPAVPPASATPAGELALVPADLKQENITFNANLTDEEHSALNLVTMYGDRIAAALSELDAARRELALVKHQRDAYDLLLLHCRCNRV